MSAAAQTENVESSDSTGSNDYSNQMKTTTAIAASRNNNKRSHDEDTGADAVDPTKHNKRAKHHVGGDCVCKELLCPITRELPIDPVTAEDGCTYERAAIKKHFRENPVVEPGSSPIAGARVGRGGGVYEYWRGVLDYVLGTFSFRLGGFSVGVGGERLQRVTENDVPKRNLPCVRSPMTNALMGQNLLPAIHVRNTIRHLIENDVIDGDYADAWRKGMETKQMVEDYVKRATDGDVSVMWEVGQWHFHGRHGFDVDKKVGFDFFKRAADANDAKGMASAGSCLVEGWGTEANVCEGFLLSGLAAGLGSDLANWNLACWYHFGHVTIQVDEEKAIYYYAKVSDGTCTVQHLNDYLKSIAKTRLAKLQTRRLSIA